MRNPRSPISASRPGPKIRRAWFWPSSPMIAAGDWDVDILEDGWTRSQGRSLAAHYEERWP